MPLENNFFILDLLFTGRYLQHLQENHKHAYYKTKNKLKLEFI